MLPPSDVLAARHAHIRDTLETLDVEAFVVTAISNIRYLSNHTGSAGVLVVTPDALHLVADGRYTESIRLLQSSDGACPGLQVWAVSTTYDAAVFDCLTSLGTTVAAFEAAHVTVAQYNRWRDISAARGLTVEFHASHGVVEGARVIKDATEIGLLREGATRLSHVATGVLHAVRAGMSERDVAGLIEAGIRHAGFERLAFDTIVASGPNSALPHYRAGDRVLQVGDLLLLDFGGVLDGYCCDLTRTVSVGPASAAAQRVHGAVLAAQQAAIAAVQPGVETTAVDAAARQLLDARGLGEAFGHGTGHGLGLDIHEDPRIVGPHSHASAVLAAGMIFTIEPGAYLPGWGGVRIEDDVLVTDAGCEVLTAVPRELMTVG